MLLEPPRQAPGSNSGCMGCTGRAGHRLFLFARNGGQGGDAQPWDRLSLKFGIQMFSVFVGNLACSLRSQAVYISDDLTPFVERIELLQAGLLLVIKRQGGSYIFGIFAPALRAARGLPSGLGMHQGA